VSGRPVSGSPEGVGPRLKPDRPVAGGGVTKDGDALPPVTVVTPDGAVPPALESPIAVLNRLFVPTACRTEGTPVSVT
jgi:hypothetical protein